MGALRVSSQVAAESQDKGDALCSYSSIKGLLHRKPFIYDLVIMKSVFLHFSLLVPTEPHSMILTVQPGARQLYYTRHTQPLLQQGTIRQP